MSIDECHYVPILLAKQGERLALRDVPHGLRAGFTPLFVVPPIPWDFEGEVWAKTLDQHLAGVPNELRTAWGTAAAFVDLLFLDDAGALNSGEHPLTWLTSEANAQGLPLVPVVSPLRTAPYRAAVAAVTARDQRGACFRLSIPEWPVNLPGGTDDLLGQIGLVPQQVDLLLDLEVEAGPLALTAVRQQLAALPHIDEWRSVIVAGAAMPREMPTGQGVHVLPRSEWVRYQRLRAADDLGRIPTFADYGIAHPDPTTEILDLGREPSQGVGLTLQLVPG